MACIDGNSERVKKLVDTGLSLSVPEKDFILKLTTAQDTQACCRLRITHMDAEC